MRRVKPLEKGMPSEPAVVSTQSAVNPSKYTYATLPFTAEQKQNILTNFTAKYMKGKNTSEAQKYIEEALNKADEQGQKEIIEKLKECYR
jgi:ribosomal protein S7